jgi:hypothetical protein
MDDTSNTGGYKIPSHGQCSPPYIISEEGKNSLENKFSCPLCHMSIKLVDLITVLPKSDPKTKKHQICKTYKNCVDDVLPITSFNDTLYKLDNLKFNSRAFKITTYSHIVGKLQGRTIQNDTLEKFLNKVRQEHDFILKLDMTNMCVMGGFNRSILLDQPVNDIDFYFVGLSAEEIPKRLDQFVNQIMSLLAENHKFILAYKTHTKVYEIYCIDKKTSKLVHKIQVILLQFNNMQDLVTKSDMLPASVVFDGQQVYLTNSAHQAYKYMINVVNETKYSDIYDSRLIKYFNHGFALVLPELDIKKVQDKMLVLGKSQFSISEVKNNRIVVNNYTIGTTATEKREAMYEGSGLDYKAVLNSIVKLDKHYSSVSNGASRMHHKIVESFDDYVDTNFES